MVYWIPNDSTDYNKLKFKSPIIQKHSDELGADVN